MERELDRDLAVLLEAVRSARSELAGLRDPKRNTTPERVVRRLSDLLEGQEIERAMARLGSEGQEEDSPPLVPGDNIDLRVPYPWRAH